MFLMPSQNVYTWFKNSWKFIKLELYNVLIKNNEILGATSIFNYLKNYQKAWDSAHFGCEITVY